MITKTCRICGRIFEATNEFFHKDKTKPDGLDYRCKECVRKKVKEHREKYPERARERKRIWQMDNKEKVAAEQKRYRENNPEKVREQKRKYRILHGNSFSQYKYWKERKEMLKKLPDSLTFKQWHEAISFFDFKCCYCGREQVLTQDHFIPVLKGGGTEAQNIVPACLRCNSSKLDVDFKEWYPKQKYYNKEREQRMIDYIEIQRKAICPLRSYSLP